MRTLCSRHTYTCTHTSISIFYGPSDWGHVWYMHTRNTLRTHVYLCTGSGGVWVSVSPWRFALSFSASFSLSVPRLSLSVSAVFSSLLTARGGAYVHREPKSMETSCQLEVDVHYADLIALSPTGGTWQKLPPLRILSFGRAGPSVTLHSLSLSRLRGRHLGKSAVHSALPSLSLVSFRPSSAFPQLLICMCLHTGTCKPQSTCIHALKTNVQASA